MAARPMMMRMIDRRAALRRLGLASLAGSALAPALAGSPTRNFRMAYFATYSPLSFVEGPGETVRGILPDILQPVLGAQLGLRVSHEGYPWPRAQQHTERGLTDAICTIATEERLAYAVAVDEPVVTALTSIFVREDHPMRERLSRVRSLAELQELNLVVLSYSANGWAKARLKDFNVTWGGDFNSAVKMLIARRGDVMVENALTMAYTLQRTPGGEQVRMLPHALDTAHFQLLISKKSAHAEKRDAIGRALAQFKRTPQYAAVFQRYGVST